MLQYSFTRPIGTESPPEERHKVLIECDAGIRAQWRTVVAFSYLWGGTVVAKETVSREVIQYSDVSVLKDW